jgi:hypothetical protein
MWGSTFGGVFGLPLPEIRPPGTSFIRSSFQRNSGPAWPVLSRSCRDAFSNPTLFSLSPRYRITNNVDLCELNLLLHVQARLRPFLQEEEKY